MKEIVVIATKRIMQHFGEERIDEFTKYQESITPMREGYTMEELVNLVRSQPDMPQDFAILAGINILGTIVYDTLARMEEDMKDDTLARMEEDMKDSLLLEFLKSASPNDLVRVLIQTFNAKAKEKETVGEERVEERKSDSNGDSGRDLSGSPDRGI